jgi:PIN domain nuclease of toxin-antitoxin system
VNVAELAVLDSHALIWYAVGAWNRLGRDARRLLERADAGSAAVFVPAIVLAEVLEAERSGKVRLPGGPAASLGGLAGSTSFPVAALTLDVVRRAQTLYAIPERGDRLIAATAASLDLPLITRDPLIARAAGVELIW